jgi:hypothetical protein
MELAPDDPQLVFWSGLMLAGLGRFDEARPLFARAIAANPRYATFLRRLPAAGLFPGDERLFAALLDPDAADPGQAG